MKNRGLAVLFAVDIGNTNIVAAVFDADRIIIQWRIASDVRRTGDEYTSILLTLCKEAGIQTELLDKGIISSVVPALIGPFVIVCQHLCGANPFIVTSELAYSGVLPVRLDSSSPHTNIGADLLCNAVSAWNLFGGGPVIAVDFGTALTLTACDSRGIIRGVTISPGLGTAIKALATNAAQLPFVPLEAPPSSLGMNTETAIQAGVVLGYKGLVEYLVGLVKTDMEKLTGDDRNSVKVVATGGLNSVLKPITDIFTVVDKDLTVRGLKLISDLTQPNHAAGISE
ncbi:type III pantothenate kinase [Treponema sp.]|uniref:type III pantothenate kinase n=1 Tax=Treponema sp. TaxID=166 RepID=UPI003F0F92E2